MKNMRTHGKKDWMDAGSDIIASLVATLSSLLEPLMDLHWRTWKNTGSLSEVFPMALLTDFRTDGGLTYNSLMTLASGEEKPFFIQRLFSPGLDRQLPWIRTTLPLLANLGRNLGALPRKDESESC